MRKVLSIATGVAVAAALLSAAPASADPSRQLGPESFPLAETMPRAAANQGVLVAQRATLTEAHREQGKGYPTDPGHKLVRANVTVEVVGTPATSFIRGSTVVLGARPTEDLDVDLGFGHRAGTNCVVNKWFTDRLWGGDDPVAEFVGYHETGSKPWNCVVAKVAKVSALNTDIDVLIGVLTSTYQKPNLQIGRVSLLGQNQKNRLRLVRGVPTKIDVVVRNRGKVAARNVLLGGNGKRIKVNRAKIDQIAPGKVATLTLKVRIQGKKKPGKLRLVATGTGAKATKPMNVQRIKAPQRPRAGKYRSTKAGTVTFAVRKGRITNWRGRMTTRCGGYPDNFTYQQGTTYDFPQTKIPRNGIVQARQKGKNFTTHLRLRIAGGKVTRGQFSYYGPNRCFATTSFNAKRIGG